MGFSASSCIVSCVPGSARHIPNLISAIRILLVVPIAMALLRLQFVAALLLFALAAVSDAADGFLAKRFGWQSELGGALDPIADKLLLATAFVCLSFLKLVPLWLMVAAVARDLIIVLGAAAYQFFIGSVSAHPSLISKFNTLCQAAFILAVIGQAEFSLPAAWVTLWLGAVVFATVIVSGIDYVWVYGRRAAAA
jgi:cardiolipin synthase (CMP-forming)